MKTNVTLIGMPGAGKSTIGVVLAKVLGFDFIDTDLVIQKQTGKRLQEIIDTNGNDGFKKTENTIVSELNASSSVIATGGSVCYGNEAMCNLKKQSVVVYIKLSAGELAKRLGNLSTRGVVMPDGFTLQDLYDERNPLYEKYADVTVETQGLSIEDSVNSIVKKVLPYIC